MNEIKEEMDKLSRDELETCLLQTVGKLSTYSPYQHQHPVELFKQIVEEGKSEEHELTVLIKKSMEYLDECETIQNTAILGNSWYNIKQVILIPWLKSRGVNLDEHN